MSPKQYLFTLTALYVACGIIEPHLPHAGEPMNEVVMFNGVVMAFLIFGWVKADAAALGIKPPLGAPVASAIFCPLGVPYYFFRSRPWRSALLSTLKSVGFLIAITCLGKIAFYVSSKVT